MSKPTHELMNGIVNFVLQDQKVIGSLQARNNDPYTVGQELRCFLKQKHPTDPNRALYEVQLLFFTNDPKRENNDDISILVDVASGMPPSFIITKVVLF